MSHQICGGFGNVNIVDSANETEKETLAQLLAAIKPDLIAKGYDGESIKPLSYSTQVVAGVNYLIKLQSSDKYIHIKVCKPLPHTNQQPFLLAIDANKSLESPLLPFE